MSKRKGKDDEIEDDKGFWNNRPTRQEIDEIHAHVRKNFKQERVNGKLQSSWYMYMKTNGIIRIDEHGNPVILNAAGYHRITYIEDYYG